METRFLFPHQFKKLGWILFIPAAIVGLLWLFEIIKLPELMAPVFALTGADSNNHFTIIKNDITDEVLGILLIVGGLLVACSKEKYEDEFIAKIRLESLLWATYINYALLLLAILFVYNFAFFDVMRLNMFTLLLIFIARFNFILYKSGKPVIHEKQY